jgi:hypothetical protein
MRGCGRRARISFYAIAFLYNQASISGEGAAVVRVRK